MQQQISLFQDVVNSEILWVHTASAHTLTPSLDKRLDPDGQVEYFVKCKGYKEEENAWKPIENFETKLIK